MLLHRSLFHAHTRTHTHAEPFGRMINDPSFCCCFLSTEKKKKKKKKEEEAGRGRRVMTRCCNIVFWCSPPHATAACPVAAANRAPQAYTNTHLVIKSCHIFRSCTFGRQNLGFCRPPNPPTPKLITGGCDQVKEEPPSSKEEAFLGDDAREKNM